MKKRSIRLLLSALLVLGMAFQSFAAPLSYAGPTAASEPAKITGTWSMDASDSWHFNAPDGAAKDGWYYLNTTNDATDYNWFCFDANGVMRTGWVPDKNDPSVWYYTGESKDSSEGGLVKGWITDPQDGQRYYLDPSTGIMCHGWKQIDGVWYYFTESRYADRGWAPDTKGYWMDKATGRHSHGSLYVNERTPDGYYVGANGAWVQDHSEDDNSDKPDPAPETKKLSEILPSGFPTLADSAWVNADGKKAYKDGDNIKVGNLTLGKDTTATKSGDNYVCKSGDATVTFNVKAGAAESITVTGSGDSNGTYAPAVITFDENPFDPGNIKAGRTLTIKGKNLDAVTKVIFCNDVEATTFKSQSSEQIVIEKFPAKARTGKVTLVSGTTSQKITSDVDLVVAQPSVSEIYQFTGVKPNQWLTIEGENFDLVYDAIIGDDTYLDYNVLHEGHTIEIHMPGEVHDDTVKVIAYSGVEVTVATVTAAAPATTFKAVYDTTNGANTLTFYYDAVDHSGDKITVYDKLPTAATKASDWGYSGNRSDIKKVVIDSSVANYTGLASTAYMFQSMKNAVSISGAEYLDVSNVTDMSYMFNNFGGGASGSPTTLNVVPDVSKWNTGNVTNMTGMFAYYGNNSNLDKVPDVSGWNTGNVTNMQQMFQKYGHESQNFNAVPDVSNWNTGNVTNMTSMFFEYGYKSTKLDTVPGVSKWNTGNVEKMSSMFNGYGNGNESTNISCVLDLSEWDLSEITEKNGENVFKFNPKTFSVTIPAKTGEKSNDGEKWYYGDGTNTIAPPAGKSFTPVTPKYMDWDADKKELVEKPVPADAIEVTNTTTSLLSGKFYIVKGADVQTGTLTVNGTATLILMDGAKLTATGGAMQNAGINVASGKTLVITGQKNGTGILVANGYCATGIGGGAGSSGGTVTINGGTVTAYGGAAGAGIGGGVGGNGGTVTINGGTVTATGKSGGAGIGGGFCPGYGGKGGTVTINGGTVTATGGDAGFGEVGAAIGKGANGSSPGTVTFGEGVNFTINAGADKDHTESKTTAEYSADHSAAYVSIEESAAPTISTIGDIIHTLDSFPTSYATSNWKNSNDVRVYVELGYMLCFEKKEGSGYLVLAASMDAPATGEGDIWTAKDFDNNSITFTLENGVLKSITLPELFGQYPTFSGTYAPAVSTMLTLGVSGGQTHDAPMAETEVSEPTAEVFEPEFEPEKFEEAKPEELIEPAEAVAEEAAP